MVESTLIWYDKDIKLPTDITKEEAPDWGDFGCIIYKCLAVFEDRDRDTGKIYDREVVAVSYCENLGGWLYMINSLPYSEEDLKNMTMWCSYPDPIKRP